MPLFAILTLFPEALEPYLRAGIVGIAQAKGLVHIRLVDFRDFARDRHRTVDDRPYGGGPGMVLRPEPIVECIEWLEDRHGPFRRILLCPGGRVFRQELADDLSREERVLLLCGRYEGIDARVAEILSFEPVSIGDYVLAGGELPSLVVAEAVVRLLPGALGDERSAVEESFRARDGRAPLDHPHYTRPKVYRGLCVPDVLMSGDHAAIARWREEQARLRTKQWRPDLHDPPPLHDPKAKDGPETGARSPESGPPRPETRSASPKRSEEQ